jgi:hypothetical protein
MTGTTLSIFCAPARLFLRNAQKLSPACRAVIETSTADVKFGERGYRTRSNFAHSTKLDRLDLTQDEVSM